MLVTVSLTGKNGLSNPHNSTLMTPSITFSTEGRQLLAKVLLCYGNLVVSLPTIRQSGRTESLQGVVEFGA
jgi:hypothetical protein